MAPDCNTHYHTMSSPNTNALMTMLNNAVRAESKPTAAGFKMVYVGKDKVALNILEMSPIESEPWKKSSAFESLCATMQGQVDVHSVSDLISIISQEIPIDVTSAFMESNRIKETVIRSMTDFSNLTGLAFLQSNGSMAKNLTSSTLEHRHADLAFIKLGCCIAGNEIDERIQQNSMEVQFCLKLPQSSYDQHTGTVITLTSPSSRKKLFKPKDKGGD